MKKPSQLFKEAQERALRAPYQAKFKRGDVVMNVAYGVVSLIVDVQMGTDYKLVLGKMECIENTPIQYVLKDIKNDKSTIKDINRKQNRFKDCKTVDKFYTQVNPETARLLYGIG